jgi:hypothetical protein
MEIIIFYLLIAACGAFCGYYWFDGNNCKCPDCHGVGETYGPKNLGANLSTWDWGPCRRCHNTGTIPKKMKGWIEKGKELRAKRLSEDKNFSEKAQELGVSIVVISDMEAGYRDNSKFEY